MNPRDNQQLIDEPTIIVKSNLNEIKDKKGQLKQPSETKSVGKSETKGWLVSKGNVRKFTNKLFFYLNTTS